MIRIIQEEIEKVIDPELCSWKNMRDFIMNSEAKKSAPVYESCRRALQLYNAQFQLQSFGKKSKVTKKDK